MPVKRNKRPKFRNSVRFLFAIVIVAALVTQFAVAPYMRKIENRFDIVTVENGYFRLYISGVRRGRLVYVVSATESDMTNTIKDVSRNGVILRNPDGSETRLPGKSQIVIVFNNEWYSIDEKIELAEYERFIQLKLNGDDRLNLDDYIRDLSKNNTQ